CRIEGAFLATQLGDCLLDRSQRLTSRPHMALPPGDEATLERHLVIDCQVTAALHPQAVVLDYAIITLVAGDCLERCLGYPYAELGDDLSSAGLFVADGETELAPIGG